MKLLWKSPQRQRSRSARFGWISVPNPPEVPPYPRGDGIFMEPDAARRHEKFIRRWDLNVGAAVPSGDLGPDVKQPIAARRAAPTFSWNVAPPRRHEARGELLQRCQTRCEAPRLVARAARNARACNGLRAFLPLLSDIGVGSVRKQCLNLL
jgi:hypothetical protein